jgi:asparagine synthase (glutamine-hydrolysing)
VSGLTVVYNLDGRPADPAICERMTAVISHRGPDGTNHFVDGPVGLGYCSLRSTPESPRETQPLSDETGSLCLVMDGRVDNGSELRADLLARRAILRTDADAELVLRAYELWGDDSPRRIVGDFAYVIWDKPKQQLFCARDHLGIRPFYYFFDGRTFLCASEPRALLEHPTVQPRPNEGMVAEYLAYEITSVEDTLYEGIQRLPPAHFIVVRPSGFRKQRYWEINRSHQICYKADQEYVDHFNRVFKEAVRCRLRSHRPVAAELSGGVDSSCVVGMCQYLLRGGFVPDVGFETFSLVFPGLPADETAWFRQVVDFWNLNSNEVPAPPDPAWYPACAKRYLDLPDHANGHMADFCSTLAYQKGCRVILTGLGGDDWFGHPPVPQSRLRRAFYRLRAQPDLDGIRSLLHDSIRVVRRAGTSRTAAVPWIPDAFALRSRLAERIKRKKRHDPLSHPVRLYCLEMKDRASARCGVEARHPYHDRRLIELLFAFPPDLFQRAGHNKYILRQAMRGLVPESVLQRLTKAEFSHTSAQLFECDSISAVFQSARIASQGWIDQGRVAAMFHEFISLWNRGQRDNLPHVWPLDMVLGIELWFRAAFP